MQAPHYRKIELQSPADLTYLYANAVALSRQKLDLHLPPPANNEPDPMRERVKELVDEFINQTFTYASASISINGLDFNPSQLGANSANNAKNPFPFPSPFSAPETVEYEPYDTELAARVTSLYAQLESLTTTVAQLRRDAPKRAAKNYADALTKALEEDDAEAERLDRQAEQGVQDRGDQDVEMTDDATTKTKDGTEGAGAAMASSSAMKPEWKLQIPFNSDNEAERWHNGEMAEIYSDSLRTLLRLQGEVVAGDEQADSEEGSRALATTVGKAERAGRAAEVVEKM
ncbi:hypothetical protein T310_7976 [Rasamsonia emersonii CBS 393.64]|uniref:Kinetochore protein mis14 n=1 Tax=Rasamsonia emersonii (strain ATCC 16479 / CBS 393.64 / IMI 116815) TaxID=1408163 RepID=A0A0F4YJL7_RASE3|nr:hypothetical protein T310_7976 [Rasamsonia emersonii CBS 393.64]KKA18076.1 hypothetical protein T310_7976 [Rasamsonia emersonii CBS 393.64]